MKIMRTAAVGMSLNIFCRGLLAELKSEGYDIVAVASPEDGELQQLGEREGVRTVPVHIERRISLLADLKSLWHMYRVMRRERPDMVHSMTPKAGLLTMIAAWLAHVPVRVHTFTGLVWPTSKGLSRLILKTTDRITCFCATYIVPEGEGVRHDMIEGRITRKPLKVLGYGNVRGVDMSHYTRQTPYVSTPEPFTFLFVGRLVGDKGVNELVWAFCRLKEQMQQPLRLVMVGMEERELDPLLPETIAAMEQTPEIVLPGYISDVRPWMEQSHVYVHPSYREGFPNVVLEAGAMDMPSIVTDINGSREIINGDNGLIVQPRNREALLDAMAWMMNNPSERKAMAAVSRKWVADHWDQDFVRQCLKQFYKEITTCR